MNSNTKENSISTKTSFKMVVDPYIFQKQWYLAILTYIKYKDEVWPSFLIILVYIKIGDSNF